MSRKIDLAWFSGLFDGEGCIHINRQRVATRADLKTDSFRLFVQVTMGHLPTLERCLQIHGVGSIQPHTTVNKKSNPAFCWMTSASEAVQVLKTCRPYVTTKRAEVDLGISFALLQKWNVGGKGGNTTKPQELVDQLTIHYWTMRMIKPRWRFYARKLSRADRAEIKRLGL